MPALWRINTESPENRDVHQLLVNSLYNLGVRHLRQGKPGEAQAAVLEAVKLDRNDAFAQRLLLFARSYSEMNRDLLYDVFVENLQFRP